MRDPAPILAILLAFCATANAQSRFSATGLSSPLEMQPEQQGVVEVHFDLLPTSMRFNAPAYPCLVTENGIMWLKFESEEPIDLSLRRGEK